MKTFKSFTISAMLVAMTILSTVAANAAANEGGLLINGEADDSASTMVILESAAEDAAEDAAEGGLLVNVENNDTVSMIIKLDSVKIEDVTLENAAEGGLSTTDENSESVSITVELENVENENEVIVRSESDTAHVVVKSESGDLVHVTVAPAVPERRRERRCKKECLPPNPHITILYGGNAQGVVIPYPPSTDALGGISRYAARHISLREEHAVTFSIDIGNLLERTSNDLRLELAAAYYQHMKFDAIALGGGEVNFGLERFMRAQRVDAPFFITNFEVGDVDESGISNSLYLTKEGYGIYILNFVAESVLDDAHRSRALINIGSVQAQLATENAKNANLRIAIVHGTFDEIRRIIETFPMFDIIIAGSLETRFDTPRTIGNTMILSAGSQNRFAGRLTLKYSNFKRDKLVATEHRLYPILQEIEPNEVVENLTGFVRADIVVEEATNIIPRPADGIIPYLSWRGGREAVPFIKAVEIQTEYDISGGISAYPNRDVIVSPVANRAAFMFSGRGGGALRMVDLATMNGRTVASGKNVIEAAFSPVENFLYYIEVDTNNVHTIYKTRMFMFDALKIFETDYTPLRDLSISPDGASVLFSARDTNTRRWQAYALDTSFAAAPRRLTRFNADHRRPRMSAFGGNVAYLSDLRNFGTRMDLYVIEEGRRGPVHRQITTNSNVQSFTWCDTSQTIYFSAGTNILEIVSVNINEMRFRKIVSTSPGVPKTWSEENPIFMRYKGAPKIVYTRVYLDGSRQLYWYDITSGTNEPLLKIGEERDAPPF